MQTQVEHKAFHVAGLPVDVHTNGKLSAITGSVAVLFFLHGKGEDSEVLRPLVEHTLKRIAKKRADGQQGREVVVVTFDQRNHGHRFIDKKSFTPWTEENPAHPIDLYATFVGTAKDVSFLIDFLPAYIFPSGEAKVDQWLVGGISLGGHAAWWSLCHEPRISMGIPIIGTVNFTGFIAARAKSCGFTFAPPTIPQTFIDYVKATDPAQVPYTSSDGAKNPFVGKKILVLSGKDDPIVPWVSSDEVVKNLNVGEAGVKKVIVYPGVGHDCPDEMIDEMAQFVWEHALAEAAA